MNGPNISKSPRPRIATAPCILGWTGDNGDPDNFLAMLLGCDAVGGNNRAQWCNKEFDDLVTKAKETADLAERTKLYEQAQVVFKKEAPWATIAHSLVVRADAQGSRGLRSEPARRLRLRRRRHRRITYAISGMKGARLAGAPFCFRAKTVIKPESGPRCGKGTTCSDFFWARLAVMIPTFIGVSIIAFSFIRMLPGDPVALLSGERVMSPERHAAISHELGFDRPIVMQYLDYLWGVAAR